VESKFFVESFLLFILGLVKIHNLPSLVSSISLFSNTNWGSFLILGVSNIKA
jgi:hypothetical protein